MAIQVENSASIPELVYNKVFMEDLHIRQRQLLFDGERPFYNLTITVRMYAVDASNNRHYAQKTDILEISDYQKIAEIKAMAGDMDLAIAGEAIKQALIEILADQRPELGIVQEV